MRHSLFLLLFFSFVSPCFSLYAIVVHSLDLDCPCFFVFFIFARPTKARKREKRNDVPNNSSNNNNNPVSTAQQNTQTSQDTTRQGDILRFPLYCYYFFNRFHDTKDPTKECNFSTKQQQQQGMAASLFIFTPWLIFANRKRDSWLSLVVLLFDTSVKKKKRQKHRMRSSYCTDLFCQSKQRRQRGTKNMSGPFPFPSFSHIIFLCFVIFQFFICRFIRVA